MAAPATFTEDRKDFALRAYPRIAVGSAGWCLVIVGGCYIFGGPDVGRTAALILIPALVFSLLIRGDVISLQFGKSVRYELYEDKLVVFRGDRVTDTVVFDEVEDWNAAVPAMLWEFWLGFGRTRKGGGAMAVDHYAFEVRTPEGEKRRVEPPGLFRWDDRGGLDDVTRALFDKIGKPPTNWPIDRRG